jgi:hypothetical protein
MRVLIAAAAVWSSTAVVMAQNSDPRLDISARMGRAGSHGGPGPRADHVPSRLGRDGVTGVLLPRSPKTKPVASRQAPRRCAEQYSRSLPNAASRATRAHRSPFQQHSPAPSA